MKKGKGAVSLSFAAESIELICGCSADISTIAINLAEDGLQPSAQWKN